MAVGRRSSLGNEALAFAEFVRLFADPLYYGIGVPRGDGRPVLVLPGLFANDWYLWPLRGSVRTQGASGVKSTAAQRGALAV